LNFLPRKSGYQSRKGAVTGILIARWIEENGTAAADRRVRSTFAHEGGHGLLHPKLFIAEQTGDLFGRNNPTPSRPKSFLCRGSDISPAAFMAPKYDGKWWEWQARATGLSCIVISFLLIYLWSVPPLPR
jgi:hypothetical protein